MTKTQTRIGFRPHTGWAAYSVVTGSLARPILVAKGRVELVGGGLPGHAYHAAQGMPPAEAHALVEAVWESAEEMADKAIASLSAEHDIAAVAIIGTPRDLPPLERIVTSHALLHTAEGTLFTTVLADAAERAGLATTIIEPGSLPELTPAIAELGKPFGPPWRKDHKEAVVAALST